MVFGEKQDAIQRIEEEADIVDRAFCKFREMQTEQDMPPSDFAEAKKELRRRLDKLTGELDRYLASEYGIDANKKEAFDKWRKTHQPFHWFAEFYGILKAGGFDVIIGNPPYVEYGKVKKNYTLTKYKTESCGNLYAYIIERCFDTLSNNGRMGMIIQLPIICTDRMKPLQKECLEKSKNIWFATFDDRPARLFEGLEHIRATIFTSQKGSAITRLVFSTKYNRWYSDLRHQLFDSLSYSNVSAYIIAGAIPKIGQDTAKNVRLQITNFLPIHDFLINLPRGVTTYFHNSPQYWIRAMDFAPYFWNERDGEQISTQVKTLHLPSKADAAVTVAVLNSSLFYWWFLILSDCRHLNMREIENFPIGIDRMTDTVKTRLAQLTRDLMADFKRHKQRKECEYKATGKVIYDEFYPKHSKPIIDEIDCVLARHYGFSDEELDFIVNYDIKYRMGIEEPGDEEE